MTGSPASDPAVLQPVTVMIPRRWLIAASIGAAAIVALLGLVLVVLVGTRDRSVSLDAKSSRLLVELTAIVQAGEPALEAAQPTLDALPQTPTTARQKAAAARQLSTETHQFLIELKAAGLPASLGPLTRLPTSLTPLIDLVDGVQEQNQIPSLVTGLSRLSDSVNRDGLVSHASALFTQTPAILRTLTEVRGLLVQVRSSRLIPIAAHALQQIPSIHDLLARSLQVQGATLSTTRDTTTAVRAISPKVISDILSIAEQILGHATSLDNKIGVVP